MKPANEVRQLSNKELLIAMEKEEPYSPYVLAMEYLRRNKDKTQRIRYPADILSLVEGYAKRKQECFIVITLDASHIPIKKNVISMGLVNRTIIHPREVYRKAINQNAVEVVIAHNHPSGNVEPSDEDREITHRIKEAGILLGISLIDHIIFAKGDYFSFLEKGLI